MSRSLQFTFTNLLFVILVFFHGCSKKGTEGASCLQHKECRKGLICAVNGKCLRPISCKKLKRKLNVCSEAFLDKLIPDFHLLAERRRKNLSSSLKNNLSKKLFLKCKKLISPPMSANRQGGSHNDTKLQFEEWKKCLEKNACTDFVECTLKLANYKKNH